MEFKPILGGGLSFKGSPSEAKRLQRGIEAALSLSEKVAELKRITCEELTEERSRRMEMLGLIQRASEASKETNTKARECYNELVQAFNSHEKRLLKLETVLASAKVEMQLQIPEEVRIFERILDDIRKEVSGRNGQEEPAKPSR